MRSLSVKMMNQNKLLSFVLAAILLIGCTGPEDLEPYLLGAWTATAFDNPLCAIYHADHRMEIFAQHKPVVIPDGAKIDYKLPEHAQTDLVSYHIGYWVPLRGMRYMQSTAPIRTASGEETTLEQRYARKQFYNFVPKGSDSFALHLLNQSKYGDKKDVPTVQYHRVENCDAFKQQANMKFVNPPEWADTSAL